MALPQVDLPGSLHGQLVKGHMNSESYRPKDHHHHHRPYPPSRLCLCVNLVCAINRILVDETAQEAEAEEEVEQ